MRLVRFGLFVLVLIVGAELYAYLRGVAPTFSVATMFPITLSLTALITWIVLRLVDWMVLDKYRRTVKRWKMTEELLHDIRNILSSLRLSARIELPVGSTRAGDLS
jgi:hypothetical protein